MVKRQASSFAIIPTWTHAGLSTCARAPGLAAPERNHAGIRQNNQDKVRNFLFHNMKCVVLLSLAFAGISLATPVYRRSGVAHCGVNTGGDINVSSAAEQARNAPTDDHGRSYPHQFKNYEGLPMSNACSGASMMLELPVFADGHAYNIAHGEKPGAARVIYSADDHSLCAIVAHDSNDSNFHLCSY